jgi:uncharacterized lipoprotein YddW (UPF0748 family)
MKVLRPTGSEPRYRGAAGGKLRSPLFLMVATMVAVSIAWSPGAHAQSADALPELRGVWVHEVSLGNPAAVDATMREIAEAGFNVAYVRTWFQGVTLYPSDVVEAAGGLRQHRTFVGRDPLQEAIDAGQRYGVEVGAWMEYGLVAHTGYATGFECDRPGPILEANPSWSMVHRSGYIAEPPSVQNGLCFYWMDPAHPEVIAFLRDMAAEIAERYPEMALYEGDRFRYPSLDWSFAEDTIARYMAETGLRDPREHQTNDPERNAWRDWRRAQTTYLMSEVYHAVKEANPSMVVSAAVVPPYMIDTSQDKLQHWPTWAAQGVIDIVEPMLYLPDSHFQNQLGLALNRMPPGPMFAAGIEARDDPNFSVAYQIEEARRRGVDGVVLWCWDRCPLAPWIPTLRDEVFAAPATLPFHDRIGRAGDAAHSGPWQQASGGFSGGHHVLLQGTDGEAEWRLELMRYGYYDVYAYWAAGEDRTPDARYEVVVDGQAHAFTADQGQGSGWHFLGQVYAPGPGEATVTLRSGTTGATVADAVRLLRSEPFRATQVLAVGETSVQVRFNYAPDPAMVATTAFTLHGSVVRAAEVTAADPYVVRLEVDPLTPEATYTLEVHGLRDHIGRDVAGDALTFTFDPTALERLVVPGDATFFLNGTWNTVPDATAPGSSYRTAAGGVATNRARWNATLPASGLYEISVWIPEGETGRSESVGYMVAYGTARFDTVYVAHRAGASQWHSLGVFPYEAGGTGLVQLLGGLSEPGEMVASAVRWRQTLSTVDAEDSPQSPLVQVAQPYPNPTRGVVNLSVQASRSGTARIAVLDLLGKLVATRSEPILEGPQELKVDLSGFSSGAYLLRIQILDDAGRVLARETRRITVIR